MLDFSISHNSQLTKSRTYKNMQSLVRMPVCGAPGDVNVLHIANTGEPAARTMTSSVVSAWYYTDSTRYLLLFGSTSPNPL